MDSDPSNLQQFFSEARDCAVAMKNTAAYIEYELPNVSIEEPTLSKLIALLPRLAGTGHTVYESVTLLHALQIPAGKNVDQRVRTRSLAFVLVAESAVNILNPFNRASAAAERLLAELS